MAITVPPVRGAGDLGHVDDSNTVRDALLELDTAATSAQGSADAALSAVGDHTHPGEMPPALPIDGGTMTGQLLLPNGAPAAPSLAHAGDTDTGIYFPAADTVAIATGTTERVRVNASGNVGIGGSPVGSPLEVATTQQTSITDPTNATAADGTVRLRLPSGGTQGDGQLGPGIAFGRINSGRRGALIASVQTSSDADTTGLLFAVRQGTSTGNDTLLEAVRIDHNGLLTGSGASLGAWTAYTPTLTADGGTITSYTVNSAHYVQIGKTVHVSFDVTIIDNGTATGGIRLTTPVAAKTSGAPGSGVSREVAVTGAAGVVEVAADNTIRTWKYDGTTFLIDSYRVRGSATYEAA